MKKIWALPLAFLLLFSAAAAEESRSLPTINVDAVIAEMMDKGFTSEDISEAEALNEQEEIISASEPDVRMTVDKRARTVTYTFVDSNQSPEAGINGYASVECQYQDIREYPYKIRYLDTKGNRALNPDGYSVVKLDYDGWRRVTELTFYGTDGKIRNTAFGYAHVYTRYESDILNRVTFMDAKGKRIDDPEGALLESILTIITDSGKPKLTFDPWSVKINWAQQESGTAILTPEPTAEPTPEPTAEPTQEPTPKSTEAPTPEPTEEPTPVPTEVPTPEPTEVPTPEPTPEPTEVPTPEPTEEPTPVPTEVPTPEPTEVPTPEPTPEPTEVPTPEPTEEPTPVPTEVPTPEPTAEPMVLLKVEMMDEPTDEPTGVPTAEPTEAPTPEPTAEPTEAPTTEPTAEPTEAPTPEPTAKPTEAPTTEPTAEPTEIPTPEPIAETTEAPTVEPTTEPAEEPTAEPSEAPTPAPTPEPTCTPVPAPVLRQTAGFTDETDAITETYFDFAGNPVLGEDGFVTRVRMMSKDKVISERWYNENNEPMSIGGETYCRVDYTYDQKGNINREKYYDAENLPVCCLDGYAIVYREFDAYQRVTYEKFYGTDGFAVQLADGTVAYRYQYDDEGTLLKTTRYDFADHEIE